MKIRPVILCGGSGTRLWTDKKYHQPKQFIDFGNWTLFGKSLERIKASIYDAPIISTNKKYLKQVKNHLKIKKIKNLQVFSLSSHVLIYDFFEDYKVNSKRSL